MLVKAGAPVDKTIESLVPYLEPGDILIDGGNEWYEKSIQRTRNLEEKGILFVSMGVSGGEIGARHGPSLMPGGRKSAYEALENILTKIAAQVDNEACVTYIGGAGSGNYVKMVHNGIEYGDMELIAEVYHLLKSAGFSNPEMSSIFADWNKSELESYLIEITSLILAKPDELVGEGYLIDRILDVAGSKGTGMMTVKEAAERGVSAPTISSALFERYISGEKDMRMRAASLLPGPAFDWGTVDRTQLVSDLKDALFCSKIVAYAQGLEIIRQASLMFNWGINLGECARIWKGGCIIRAKILDKIRGAFAQDAGLENLLLDPAFADQLVKRQQAWRRIVTLAAASGVSIPALTASLQYFDSFRSQRLPTNMIQAQRDFFGSHTYERVDQPRGQFYHCRWTSEHALRVCYKQSNRYFRSRARKCGRSRKMRADRKIS